LKKEDDVEEEQNIIPGHEDIKSKIDMKKIESIITSLNDQNYTYKSIEEFQSTLKDIAMKKKKRRSYYEYFNVNRCIW
jgi:predicted RNA-binding protein